MAHGKRRRGRRARSRGNGADFLSKRPRTPLTGNPLSRSLRLEQLEDRRLLATFSVVNPFDLQDDGSGTLEIVPGSLRNAIESANEFPDADTIVFTGFQFEQPTSIVLQDDTANAFGELAITQPVTIVGPGPGKITINAAPGSRIFNVDDGDTAVNISVNISGLTLTGGTAAGADADGQGGAIFNTENLTVTEVDIKDSSASTFGGAIFNDIGTLLVERSLIRDNTAGGDGGGIANGLAASTVDNSPTTTIVNSTITGNSATGGTGGNDAYGGGVFNRFGTLNVNHSTVFDNTAIMGSGIASWGNPPPDMPGDDPPPPTNFTNVSHTIVTGITSSDLEEVGMTEDDPPVPLLPSIVSSFNQLIGDPMFVSDIGGNPILVDAGGETLVFLPDTGSPVINAGDPGAVAGVDGVPQFDQRGQHFRRVATVNLLPPAGRIDIGAVEVQNGFFLVDTLLDELDFDHGPGDFSLREAVAFSEKNPELDTIRFSSELRDPLVNPDPNPFTPAPTILLTLGELSISDGVDILGPVFQLEIDGSSSSRIFNINDGDNSLAIPVLISDLTLLNGGGVISGGAIMNSENLTLRNSYLLNNNVALNGGALYVQRGAVTVDSSTFSDNSAANNGGGIYVDLNAGTVDIINSTLSANEAGNRGAGILNLGRFTTVQYSTITLNNSASTRGSGITNLGAGLISVHSSIVAGNLNNDIEHFNGVVSHITSLGYNVVGVGNAAFSQFVATGDQNGVVDPKLAALLFNGGPTPTHRLLDDSPARDLGDPAAVAGVGGVPLFDQRGSQFTRIFDGTGAGLPFRIDIGAYELQETTFTVDSIADENDGDLSAGNFSLREAIELANASVSPLPEKIVFDAALFGQTISLSPSGLAPFTTPDIKITSPVTILGPGLTINGSGLGVSPMFTVDDGDDLSMFGVTFEDFSFVNGTGRAIVSREDLDITGILATGNNGVFSHSVGTLTIKSSVLTGNSSSGPGGAIVSQDGNLTIYGTGYDYSLIVGNSTTVTQGHGGGISFSDSTTDGKTLSLSKVIISGNQAPAGAADGAGLYISGNGSTTPSNLTQATIVESVISGNSTTGSNSEGAGIFAKNADVTLTGTTVSLNKSFGTSSKGAGIYLSGGRLTVENSAYSNSLITQNSTYGNYAPGAGITNLGGEVTLNQVTISRNTTSGIDSHGAGIYSVGGNLTLNGTTVNDNTATAAGTKGGGIFTDTNLTGTETASIFNSTISGNTATLRGGGVYNADGLLKIQYSTITNNSVPYFGNGGGVASFGHSGTTRTEVNSSIIAGNFSTNDLINPDSDVDSVAGNVTNSFLSLGYNVIGKGLPLALNAFSQTGDQTNIIDPGLGTLTLANGGPTATHALLPTSPAINAGDPGAVAGVGNVPTYDQRGMGFPRVTNGVIDVGAFESNLLPLSAFAPTDFNNDGQVSGFDFLAWQIGFGKTNATKADGDSNGDLVVDTVDLDNFELAFGTTTPLSAPLSASQSASAPLAATAVVAEAPLPLGTSQSDSTSVSTNRAQGSFVLILGLAQVSPDLSPPEAVVREGETAAIDQSLAEYAPISISSRSRENSLDYGDIAVSRQAAEEASESEDEFLVEDAVFAVLGAG